MKKTFLLFIPALIFLMPAVNSRRDREPENNAGMRTGILHGVPVVNINNVTATEEDSVATLTISLSGAADEPVRVRYETKDGTARHPHDYKRENGVVVIVPGSLSASITIRIVKDNRIERTEYFKVKLELGRNEHNGKLGDAIGRVTIEKEKKIKTTSYVEMNNLVVVYRNTNGGTIDDTSLLSPALQQARDFYWRNSHMALNIQWTIYVIDDYLNRVHQDGRVYPWEVEADLKIRGVAIGPFDAIVAVVRGGAALAWSVDWNVDNPLEGAHFFQVPWWDEHYLFSWFFVHEFHHVIDAMFHYSGHPDYPHNHPSEARALGEYVPHSGSNWDLNAAILQYWDRQLWSDLTKPVAPRTSGWGTIRSSIDNDSDTVPDNDPNVPLDEERLGSSHHHKDSDHDGLSDLQEAMAGIFLRTDPKDVDTDCDGIPDGKDTEPVYPLKTTVPQKQGLTSGQDITEWPLSGHYYFNQQDAISSSLYLGYTNNLYTRNYLYLGVSVPFEMTSCRIIIDANNDGILYGRDNIELLVNGNTIEAVNLYDAVSSPPNDITSALPTTDFSGVLKTGTGWSSYQLIIPQLPGYDLDLQSGEAIGIYIEIPGFGHGTMLEPDDFISVVLVDETECGEKTLVNKAASPSNGTNPVLMKLTASAYPNPSAQSFILQWKGNDQPVKITITDAMGRLIETKTGVKISAVQTSTNWKPGIYYAEFVQGNEKVVMKLVKQ